MTPPLSKPPLSSKDAILSQIDDLSTRISDSTKKIKRCNTDIGTDVSLASSVLPAPIIASTPPGRGNKRDILGQMNELSRGIGNVRKSTSSIKSTTKPTSGSVRLSSIPRINTISNSPSDIGSGSVRNMALSPSALLPKSIIKHRPPDTLGSSSAPSLSIASSSVDSPTGPTSPLDHHHQQQLSAHEVSPTLLSSSIPMFTTTPTSLMEKSIILKKRCDDYENQVADLRIELDVASRGLAGVSHLKQLQQESDKENFQLKKELLSTKDELKEQSMKLDDVNSSLSSTIQMLEKKEQELKNAEVELNAMQVMLSELEEKENELTEANIKIENLQASIDDQKIAYKKLEGKFEEFGSSYKARYKEIEMAHSSLQESHDEAASASTELEAKYKETLRIYDNLTIKYEDVHLKYKDLVENHDKVCSDELPTLEKRLKESNECMSLLKADLEYNDQVINDLSKAKSELEMSHQVTSNELSTLKVALEEATRANDSLHESMGDFKKNSKAKTEELLEQEKMLTRQSAEIEQMTKELYELKASSAKVEQMTKELGELEALKTDLRASLAASQEEALSKGHAVEATQEKLKFASDALEQVQKEYDVIQVQHVKLQEEATKHESQREAVWSDLEAAMSTIGELEDDLTEYRAKVASLKDENEKAIQTHHSEIRSLKNEVFILKEKDSDQADQQSKIAALQDEKEELLKRHESEITVLQKKIEEITDNMEEVVSKDKQVSESLGKVQEDIREKDAKIENLAASYAELQQQQAMDKIEMTREKDSYEQAQMKLQRKIDGLVESNKSDVALIQSEKEKLQEELNQVLSEALSMHTAPESISSIEVELMQAKKLVEEQGQELQRLLVSDRDSRASLEIQTEKFETEILHLQSELDNVRSASSLNNEGLNSQVKSLNEALLKSEADLKQSQEVRMQLEGTVAQLQETKRLNEVQILARSQYTHFQGNGAGISTSVDEVEGVYNDDEGSFEWASTSSLASSPPPLEPVSSLSSENASPSAVALKPTIPFPISDFHQSPSEHVENQKSSERIEIDTIDSFDDRTASPIYPEKSKKSMGGVTLSNTLHAHTTGVVGTMRKSLLGWLYPNATDGTDNLGQEMEAYYDEVNQKWMFPGEEEETTKELLPPPTRSFHQEHQISSSSPSSSKILETSPSPRTKALNSMMAPPSMAMRAGSYSSFASISTSSSNQSSPSNRSSRGPSPSFLFPPASISASNVPPPPAPNTRVWSASTTATSSQNIMLNSINAEVTAPLSKGAALLEQLAAPVTDFGSPVENSNSYEAVKNINAGINISDLGVDSRDENDDDVDVNYNYNNDDDTCNDYENEPFESEVD